MPGKLTIGLHLIGGMALGHSPESAVVDEGFRVFGEPDIYAADSSIFPSAPGLNPSLTILALSLKAASVLLEEGRA
jgi:choline dehydrogenase-like flavoprotein